MFQEFFTGKFQRDLALTGQWIRFLEEQEDGLTSEIRTTVSKILNGHHIWNCRLKQVLPESDLEDLLPLYHWQQLLQANFRETIAYLDDFSAEEKIRFHDSEGVRLEQLSIDMLFQLLLDNQFYRGQLTLLCRQAGWQIVDANSAFNIQHS